MEERVNQLDAKISYIVICFNSENHVLLCLDSILNQSHKNYEIIVVDNNSTDNTRSLVTEYKKNNQTMKLIFNSTNVGYGNAVTTGTESSTGEFLAILNADAFLHPQWTSNMLKAFGADEKIMSASGTILLPSGETYSTGGMMDKFGAVIHRKNKLFYLANIQDSESFFYNDGSSFMLRKKILQETCFDPKLFLYYEDVDLSWKIRMLGYTITNVPDAISYHDVGHSFSDMNTTKFYYIIRNRFYICQKNYSLKNIICRLPIAVILMFFVAIYYDLKKKPRGFLRSFFLAMFWNITNVRHIIKEHSNLSTMNKMSDMELNQYLVDHSIELSLFRNLKS